MTFTPETLSDSESKTIAWVDNKIPAETYYGQGGMIYWKNAVVTDQKALKLWREYVTGKGYLEVGGELYIYGGQVYREK